MAVCLRILAFASLLIMTGCPDYEEMYALSLSYHLEMDVEVIPDKKASSLDVTVSIDKYGYWGRYNDAGTSSAPEYNEDYKDNDEDEVADEDDDALGEGDFLYDNQITVNLEWSCMVANEEKTGEASIIIPEGSVTATKTVTALPPSPPLHVYPFEVKDYKCSISAEVDEKSITKIVDDEEGNPHEGNYVDKVYVERTSALFVLAMPKPDLAFEVSDVIAGSPDSQAMITAKLIRNEKPVEEGDRTFDEIVEVVVKAECYGGNPAFAEFDRVEHENGGGDGEEEKNGEEEDAGTVLPDFTAQKVLRILAGQHSASGIMVLPAQELGDEKMRCEIIGSAHIDSYIVATSPTSSEFELAGRDLDITLTKAVGGKALAHKITKDEQTIDGLVDIEVSDCTGAKLVHLASDKQSLVLNSALSSINVATAQVFLTGTGTGCALTFSHGMGSERSQGKSSVFDVVAPVLPFSLNGSADVNPTTPLYSGTIYVFNSGNGHQDLVGQLDASAGISVATKLRNADDSADLATLPSGDYLVFSHQTGGTMTVYEVNVP